MVTTRQQFSSSCINISYTLNTSYTKGIRFRVLGFWAWFRRPLGLEGFVCPQVDGHAFNRTHGGRQGNRETGHGEDLQEDPLSTPLGNLLLHDEHLNWEVDSERPKCESANQPHNVVEEGKKHGDNCSEHDVQ